MNTYASKAGLPPGSLVHIGEPKNDTMQMRILSYSHDKYDEKCLNIDDISLLKLDGPNLHWISVEGIHDTDMLGKLGGYFRIHPLVLEDIASARQRPKIENYEAYTYVVAKQLSYDDEAGEFCTEQESFILTESCVITLSERESETYDPVRKRIREGTDRFRTMGTDYLIYALLDLIVDDYFVALEELGDKIDLIEEELISKPTPSTLHTIHNLKKQMLYLRKTIWPLREVIGALERHESPLVKGSTDIYLRDLYDHVIQVMDITETYRDVLSSMIDMYLSSVSNRMNEIMKVLTIISTVFIPLTFIVGLYGMNFENMPEWQWPWMYKVLWVIMISISAFMLGFFKKKGWW